MSRSFHKYETPAAVAEYVHSLNERWPERSAIIAHIVERVGAAVPNSPPDHPARVLEFCCGTGLLAQRLLEQLPQVHYTGIDFAGPFLDAAATRLGPWQSRVALLHADLNGEAWLAQLAPRCNGAAFHAVVSMQSLHDLGGEPEVARMYALARELLAPGGLFLNADLVVAPGEELPDNPGRRAIPRHLQLLRDCGYGDVRCTLERGGFGAVAGVAPPQPNQ